MSLPTVPHPGPAPTPELPADPSWTRTRPVPGPDEPAGPSRP